ncbi:MAG: hypothetical protein WC530_06740 [Candidatus Omnitrophota bacterium]|jgi:hypothetical protein
MKNLLQAKIFSGFSSWASVSYQKELTPKILRFEVQDAKEVRPLYLVSVISRDEKMSWQSFQDVLEHTMTLAQKGMRGFFGFDVLSVDIQNGIRNLDPKALSQLIINHARDLGPDQKALIRYGQIFALLHYRAPAEWGKIEVKTHVEFFSQEAAPSQAHATEASVRAALLGKNTKSKSGEGQLDLFLKKLLNASGKESRAIYIVHDLSVNPVWDPANEVQQQRVRIWLEKEQQARLGILPEIYLYHAGSNTRQFQRIGI